MITSIVAFLGSTIFRLIFGELMAVWTKRQDHKHEQDRLAQQEKYEAGRHSRQMESIRLQGEMGEKVIRVQAEADVDREEAGAWATVASSTAKTTGITLVDTWNGVIRPALATWAIVMITGNYMAWWVLDDNGWGVCGAALGIYVGSRDLFKRNK